MRETLYRTCDFLNQIQAIANTNNTHLIARSAVLLEIGSEDKLPHISEREDTWTAYKVVLLDAKGVQRRTQSQGDSTDKWQHERRHHTQPKRSSLDLMLQFCGVSRTGWGVGSTPIVTKHCAS
jgi:hypothetical protein